MWPFYVFCSLEDSILILYSIIGQKGIGFKSVFRVTDAPEIHSNGFHIKYDASKGPNGYILPEWIDQDKKEEEDLADVMNQQYVYQ